MKHLEFLTTIYDFMSHQLSLYTWRDGIEIILIATVVYTFMYWLSKDPSKQPLLFFLGYSALTASTYYAELSIVSILLLIATPIAIVLILLMHQHTLQKNIIAYKTITPQDTSYEWLDELMRAMLGALNKDKEIICVIERNDSLKDFLSIPYALNADLKKSVLEMLLEHMASDNASMLWVHHTGKIIAINGYLKMSPDPAWLSPEIKEMPLFKQDALFLSLKTDAIVLRTSSQSRTFECILDGKDIQNLTASHALNFLKRFFTKDTLKHKDAHSHAVQNDQSFTEQQLT